MSFTRSLTPILGFVLTLLALTPCAHAQRWSRTIEAQRGLRVRSGPGGEVVLAAQGLPFNLYGLGFDAAGSLSWQWLIDIQSLEDVVVGPNGSAHFLGGRFGHTWVGTLDVAGQPVWRWESLHGESAFTQLEAGLVTDNGGLVAVGTELDGSIDGDIFTMVVVHLNANGDFNWSREVFEPMTPSQEALTFGDDVVGLGDGSLVVSGRNLDDILIVKLTANGTPLWHLQIDETFPSTRTGIERSGAGGAFFYSVGNPATLIGEVDAGGTLLWTKEIDFSDGRGVKDICATPGGGALLVGDEELELGVDGSLIEILPGGAIVLERALTSSAFESVNGVDVHPQGYVLTGVRSIQGVVGWVSVTDATGSGPECASLPAQHVITDVNRTSYTSVGLQLVDRSDMPNSVPFTNLEAVDLTVFDECFGSLGPASCSPAIANSTGESADILALGSPLVARNELHLIASEMPLAQFGIFIVGQGTGTVIPPGSQGLLCLGGSSISRLMPTESTGATGRFERPLDLTAIPSHGAVLSGETWNVQAWFRDVNPQPTSNFTDARAVTFR